MEAENPMIYPELIKEWLETADQIRAARANLADPEGVAATLMLVEDFRMDGAYRERIIQFINAIDGYGLLTRPIR
jgi:hypothetical protein